MFKSGHRVLFGKKGKALLLATNHLTDAYLTKIIER